ncbi:bifunctional hydroxymethylpyrimidine kinase/phosphomethylpyrimidine kinase [Nocardia amamiensis]|uniref:Bifunctional hydroxymethylpyrimidine kinase/phosphomethylpyrimidine kinase n=1 Tax=Nocardia amamiensis TaxID=404578 RepID=A0ABS0CLR0_9NOCA|nr:PfkB family carbohydrate kinase [Nocardia amamiensis]MBF6297140.1 bifunctional hydroxymethylpyrimidine kinase/phosphomethylpyrimidine kinase [Nocardia amamiensis]
MTSQGPLVVVGDVLLDIDIEGRADRRSPDGDAPVVDVATRTLRPGGAGLAAALAGQDVADVVLIGGFATDPSGDRLRALLPERIRVVSLPFRGSTVRKERIRAVGPCAGCAGPEDRPATITRLDFGDGGVTADPLSDNVREAIDTARAVLVADYGRGAAGHPQVRTLLEARAGQIPLVWDPHPRGPVPIRDATLATPNRDEAQRFVPGTRGPRRAARMLTERWSAQAVAVTLGPDGAMLFCRGRPDVLHLPTPSGLLMSPGSDTCGAGDRFAAAAVSALADGADVEKAVQLAVAAATEFVNSGAASALAFPQDHAPVATPIPEHPM